MKCIKRKRSLCVRSLTLLLIAFPIWAQFQTAAPPEAQYPEQAQAGYPQTGYPPQYPAQQQPYPQDDQQGRDWAADQQHGVARIRVAQGDVNVKRGDNGMLTGAIMNAPLLSRRSFGNWPRFARRSGVGCSQRHSPGPRYGFGICESGVSAVRKCNSAWAR